MPAAPLPANENERLAALLALRILDTERSREFDIFPLLASRLFGTPMAAISLIDRERHWFKAAVGLEVSEIPRNLSFCAYAILEPDGVLYVPDATQDARFADNIFVTGDAGIRFYAGAAVTSPDGHAVGAICVSDTQPRQVDAGALEQLRELAAAVNGALKLHASMQEFHALAVTDPLTGLQNRAAFQAQLATAVERRPALAGSGVGLLCLDLDGFKSINELLGHAGGDAALQELARRLRRVTREKDLLGRSGGDEFCVLVQDVSDAGLMEALAERIHEALAEPLTIDQQTVPLRTSIGIAICPADAADAESLVRHADIALYDAKRAGRGLTRRYAAAASRALPLAAGRSGIREMLRAALLPPGHEPFAVALQPIFDSGDRRLTGFEALIRWPQPDGRMMQPDEFIPVAEATGLVVQLDRWMLHQACALAAGWPDELEISSNLSAANFFVGDLVDDVRTALRRHGLPARRLKLEVTESVLLRDPDHVRSVIDGLRNLGVRIILDDFGAGHASLAYLRDYSFDGLKIDRSFIAGLETDGRSLAFVRAIVALVQALGIKTTAEGIETEGQLRLLRRNMVGSLQGYLLGRPMSPAAAAGLIRASRRTSPRVVESEAII